MAIRSVRNRNGFVWVVSTLSQLPNYPSSTHCRDSSEKIWIFNFSKLLWHSLIYTEEKQSSLCCRIERKKHQVKSLCMYFPYAYGSEQCGRKKPLFCCRLLVSRSKERQNTRRAIDQEDDSKTPRNS